MSGKPLQTSYLVPICVPKQSEVDQRYLEAIEDFMAKLLDRMIERMGVPTAMYQGQQSCYSSSHAEESAFRSVLYG